MEDIAMNDERQQPDNSQILERVSKIREAMNVQAPAPVSDEQNTDEQQLISDDPEMVWGQWDSWSSWSKTIN